MQRRGPSSIKGLPVVIYKNARCVVCGKELSVDVAAKDVRHPQCRGMKAK